ncbi:MAG: hypothetical protein FWH47_06080 [Methanomassiliicoccaceae archaeon]|nr:hypothetical protein [Methanomassiliicoccaceae archaeon]
MKAFDRYSLLCISVSFIILTAVFVLPGDPEDRSMIGTAYGIKETQNGFTFYMEDTSGERVRCFCRAEPVERAVYAVKGALSDDGSMFFVSSMQMLSE